MCWAVRSAIQARASCYLRSGRDKDPCRGRCNRATPPGLSLARRGGGVSLLFEATAEPDRNARPARRSRARIDVSDDLDMAGVAGSIPVVPTSLRAWRAAAWQVIFGRPSRSERRLSRRSLEGEGGLHHFRESNQGNRSANSPSGRESHARSFASRRALRVRKSACKLAFGPLLRGSTQPCWLRFAASRPSSG